MPKLPSTAARRRARPRVARVWAWPVALGLLTASGLVGALLWADLGHIWAWFALGVTVLVMVRHACFGASQQSS